MSPEPLAVPPLELRAYVGSPQDDDGVAFGAIGAGSRATILAALPPHWGWAGRRVLDFGCGVGRTLRHFGQEMTYAEFWACDIDPRCVDWLAAHSPASLRVFRSGPAPPLHLPSCFFDLVYALSVFTHIDTEWAAWLLELRRVLRPDGLLLATFLGPRMAPAISGQPWDDATIGMNPYQRTAILPNVLHSPWWIDAHWGRAFEILQRHDQGFGAGPDSPAPSHGWVLMRPRPGTFTAADLEAPEPGEPRELGAALRGRAEAVAELRGAIAERDAVRAELERLRAGL